MTKKNKAMWGLSLITAGLVMGILAGCATTVPIKSVRSPTIDTSGIQRMAIKPFENASGVGGPLGAQLPTYMTDLAQREITNTKKFTLVSPSDPSADGAFTGTIKSINSKDSQSQSQGKDKDGNTITVTTYKREVSLEFTYSVVSARTDMPVGTVSKKGSTSSQSTESPDKLTDPLDLAKSIVDSQMKGFTKDIVPTIVSEKRKLMNETSKDKEVKARMKTAEKLVKAGNYQEAINQYDDIAEKHGSVAAKTNAATVRLAIESDAAATAQLAALFEDKDGLAEKATKNAVDAINTNLPEGSTITFSITRTQAADRQRLDYVVDGITKAVLGRLTVVDRANQALLEAEKNYQASGAVDDSSAISIGQEYGVQYIVFCGISGEKSLRRLTIRVLNVKTAGVAYQNDFEI